MPSSPRSTVAPALAPVVDVDDERIVQLVENYDEYLSSQQQAIDLLKQGFLKLTMAKMSLPAQTIGENSYKEAFSSALRVVDEEDGTFSLVKSSWLGDDEGQTAQDSVDGLRSRKVPSNNTTTTDKDDKVGSSAVKPAVDEDAAIMWFSSLPPQSLRIAQKHFRNALHALVASASCAHQIQRSQSLSTTAS